MIKNATWEFPANQGGVEYAFQDASREHFAGNPLHHLVREIIQNSLDAKDPGRPIVTVTFTETTPHADEICVDGLRKHVQSCLDQAISDSTPEAEKAYREALEILDTERICCLKIQDTGTTGLQGSNWGALVYKEGAVQKGNNAPGGSFGIGKNAVFTVTDIYTVFYSTRYLNRRKKKGRVEQMQGKARLMTHPDPDPANKVKPANKAKKLQHMGFFRMPNEKPIDGNKIPDFFRLKESGTGIFIIGFNPRTKNWVETMTSAVIENFFYAIHHKKLVVEIIPAKESPYRRQRRGNKKSAQPVNIDHETIDHLFQSQPKQSYHYHYYKAIRDKEPRQTQKIPKLGALDLYITIGEGPRRTAYINRNGMLITDSTEQKVNPIAPLRRSLWPDYTSVVMPTTDQGDKWLRTMENPSHDSILPGHLREPKAQQEAKNALKKARTSIREIIDDETEIDQRGDTINLQELAAMFPDEFNPDAPNNQALQTQLIPTRPTRPDAQIRLEADDPYDTTLENTDELNTDELQEGGSSVSHEENTNEGDSGGNGGSSGDGNDLKKVVPARPTRLLSPRIFPKGKRELIIAFTASDDRPVRLALTPRGSELKNRENSITITNATVLQPKDRKINLEDGVVSLTSKAEERVKIRITTDHDIDNQAFTIG